MLMCIYIYLFRLCNFSVSVRVKIVQIYNTCEFPNFIYDNL